MNMLKKWTPWTIEKVTEVDEKGEEKIIGSKAVFHKTFYKWNGRTYDVRSNKFIKGGAK